MTAHVGCDRAGVGCEGKETELASLTCVQLSSTVQPQ